ncbi:hypothetical protein GRI89_03240 [Altererythrobacter salegens]|uniref:Uncharacterized protein n=1 Tax=Croceibacterium salegens TaxID=1737568 RepID=A0A6I4SUR7_9SPHN|nr:hypothetical protein [Croceibacterium salegens]MXO58556.1 hypothetical protein [Croceibacterium salegens]
MSVKLFPKGTVPSFPLTSPPKPYGHNGKEWFAREINFTDRVIAITHPFPDMIDLVAPISEHTQCFPDLSEKPPLQKAQQLDQEIKTHLKAFPAVEDIKLRRIWPPHSPERASICLESEGQHLGFVELWRTNNEGFPSWSIRIEFNPRRLGVQGLERLRARFEMAFCMLNLGSIFREARMSRLDASVDVLGVLPIDLIVRVKGLAKMQDYRSRSGALETRLFFGEKLPSTKPTKPLGPLRLKIYDKVAECKASLKPAPFSAQRITRLEVSRTWKSHRPALVKILSVKNPFVGLEVACSGRDDLVNSRLWHSIVEKACVYGIENVPIGKPVGQGVKLASIYRTIQPDILSSKTWESWETGCALTGLLDWVKDVCEDDYASLPFNFE